MIIMLNLFRWVPLVLRGIEQLAQGTARGSEHVQFGDILPHISGPACVHQVEASGSCENLKKTLLRF